MQEGVRLLGITVSHLQSGCGQLSLFDQQDQKRTAVYETIDKLRNKFGEGIVTKGRLVNLKNPN